MVFWRGSGKVICWGARNNKKKSANQQQQQQQHEARRLGAPRRRPPRYPPRVRGGLLLRIGPPKTAIQCSANVGTMPRSDDRRENAFSRCVAASRGPGNDTLRSMELGRSLPLRIGIATLVSANTQPPCASGYGCALLPWCASARRLQAALQTRFDAVEILLVHSARGTANESAARSDKGWTCHLSSATETFDRNDCPGARVVQPTRGMLAASAAHADRVIRSGVMSYHPKYIQRGYVFLWKWELFRLDEFDAILHADLDVDLLPPGARPAPVIAHEWATRLPPLAELARGPRGLRQLGYADATTPWNGGMFWVFPPRGKDRAALQLYREGLRVLRANWNHSHGWECAGTPRSLFAHKSPRDAEGRPTKRVLCDLKDWTRMDSGDLDQGFLMYMMWHRYSSGGYMAGHTAGRAPMHLPAHFVRSPRKPWLRALHYKAVTQACTHENMIRHTYIRHAGLDSHATPRTACGRAYRAAADELASLNSPAARAECCRSAPVATAGGHDLLFVF